MKITEQLLSKWGACGDGKRTFTQKFPEGAEYAAVIAACDEEGYQGYRNWIFNRAFQHLEAKEIVEAEKALIPVAIEQGLKILEEQDVKDTDSISKESEARLAASGNRSRLAASGDDSQLAASGDDSQLAASGDDSRLAASGYYSQLAASGDDSRLAASGKNSIVSSSGLGSTFKLGEGGCAAIPYRDAQEKVRFAVAYVGENVQADTWYQVNATGEFIKVEE
ncbi:YdhT family protein [Acinetobacter haemolyticus]|uniref:hypothetical protein n=1 Tax=Acinetobacter haemolyticus TaxID=29430 RepID=UPI001331D213|nr:hypothetical protein [Acinetobacter haemolyticus]QHI17211.1 hypothetical protein AhaeAN4_11770 [Acinetobacter haemolyticus]